LEELPQFFGLVSQYVEIILDEIIQIQVEFMEKMRDNLMGLYEYFEVDMDGFSHDRITADYSASMAVSRPAYEHVRQIGILKPWFEQIWSTGRFDAQGPSLKGSTLKSASKTSLGRSNSSIGSANLIDISSGTSHRGFLLV
jgi:hypothetical protein